MKRTLLLLIVFAILGSVVAWYIITKEDDKTTLLGEDRKFAVENMDEIHKIFLADREGNETTLEKKNTHWLFNEKWKARPNAMENLLTVIEKVQMQYKPPIAAVKNIVNDLAAQGIKVEIYNRSGELMKAYYVGGATPDERGTYMINDGAEQPYVTHIPGWEGNLRFRYNLLGEDWRDKSIFSETPEDITYVSIEYPKQRNKSFILEAEGKEYQIRPFFEVTPAINGVANQGLAETFLDGFESLVAEAFETKNPKRDSVTQLIPFSIVTVKDKDGNENVVRLHPIYPETEMVLNPKTGEWEHDGGGIVERYFADCSSGEFMLTQHRVFKKVLWAYEFFYE